MIKSWRDTCKIVGVSLLIFLALFPLTPVTGPEGYSSESSINVVARLPIFVAVFFALLFLTAPTDKTASPSAGDGSAPHAGNSFISVMIAAVFLVEWFMERLRENPSLSNVIRSYCAAALGAFFFAIVSAMLIFTDHFGPMSFIACFIFFTCISAYRSLSLAAIVIAAFVTVANGLPSFVDLVGIRIGFPVANLVMFVTAFNEYVIQSLALAFVPAVAATASSVLWGLNALARALAVAILVIAVAYQSVLISQIFSAGLWPEWWQAVGQLPLRPFVAFFGAYALAPILLFLSTLVFLRPPEAAASS